MGSTVWPCGVQPSERVAAADPVDQPVALESGQRLFGLGLGGADTLCELLAGDVDGLGARRLVGSEGPQADQDAPGPGVQATQLPDPQRWRCWVAAHDPASSPSVRSKTRMTSRPAGVRETVVPIAGAAARPSVTSPAEASERPAETSPAESVARNPSPCDASAFASAARMCSFVVVGFTRSHPPRSAPASRVSTTLRRPRARRPRRPGCARDGSACASPPAPRACRRRPCRRPAA